MAAPLPAALADEARALQGAVLPPSAAPSSSDAQQLLVALDARAQALAQEMQAVMASHIPGGFAAFKVSDAARSQTLEALLRDLVDATARMNQPGSALDVREERRQDAATLQARVDKLNELCSILERMAKLQGFFDEFDRAMDEAKIKSAAQLLGPMDQVSHDLAKLPVVGRPARALMLRRKALFIGRLGDLLSAAVSCAPDQGMRVAFEAHLPSLKRAVRLEDIVAACVATGNQALLDQVVVNGLVDSVLSKLLLSTSSHPQSAVGFTLEEVVTEADSSLVLRPATDGVVSLGRALEGVFTAVRFVWSRVFDERGLELVPSLWPKLEALLLARLREAVPDTAEGLSVFTGLSDSVRKLETSLTELGLGNDKALSEVVLNAEESFAHKARVARLARARTMLLGEDARNSCQAPLSHGRVSVAAVGLLVLAKDCLSQASESPSPRHAKVLCQTARDVFELFRALAPLRLRSTPRDALLFRNDCEMLAGALCTMGHEYHALGVITVDLAPGMFYLGDSALADEVNLRAEELEKLLLDALTAKSDFTRVIERIDIVKEEWLAVAPDAPVGELLASVEGGFVAAMGKAPQPLKSRQEAWALRERAIRLSEALKQRGLAGGLGVVVASLEPHVSLPLFVNDLAAHWKPGLALGMARYMFSSESTEHEMKDAERKLM